MGSYTRAKVTLKILGNSGKSKVITLLPFRLSYFSLSIPLEKAAPRADSIATKVE